jgi:WD40 repeat protein
MAPPADGTNANPEGTPNRELTEFLSAAERPDEIGRLGSYRILKILGHGGMGVVFLAEDPHLQRRVALKAMLPGMAASAGNRERFLREARAAAAIEHDHIVPIFQVGEHGGVPFIAMPFLKGQPLDGRLQDGQALPVEETLRIGREAAEGLAAAHACGLIHRDIKPGNLWLEGDRGRVKILDFGLARTSGGSSQLTQQGAIIGTPAYMAPEQATGGELDGRADLFSLGCVLYRLATGRLAFSGNDIVATLLEVASKTPPEPHEVNPEGAPRGLSDLIMHLLAKEPGNRPGSAGEVAEALRALETQGPGGKPAGSENAPNAEPARTSQGLPAVPGSGQAPGARHGTASRRGVLLGLAAVVVVGAAVGGFFAFRSRRATVPLDMLRREKIDAKDLAEVGGGDPANAPTTLVAVLGTKAHTVGELAFSPDGRMVAVGLGGPPIQGVPRGIELLDAGTLEVQRIIPDSYNPPSTARGNSLAFSPDGKWLASGVYPQVQVWEAETRKFWLTCPGVDGDHCAFAFANSKQLVVSNARQRELKVRDLESRKEVQTFQQPFGPIGFVALHPDGKTFFTKPFNLPLRRVSITTGETMKEFTAGDPNDTGPVVCRPDGARVAAANRYDKEIHLWDVDDGQLLDTLKGHTGPIWTLAFRRDGKVLASGSDDGTVRLWSLETGKNEVLPLGPPRGPIRQVVYSPEGRHLAVVHDSGVACLVRLAEATK